MGFLLAVCAASPPLAEAADLAPEYAWQARCVGRLGRALEEAQKLDPSYSASRISTPYTWNDSGKYLDATPGAELRLQHPGQSAFEVPFSVAVHLEMSGHESDVPPAWTSGWGQSLDPTRRFFWARERQELVDLAQPGDTALWRYFYSRRQGNVVASIFGGNGLASPVLLRRLVQLFEPAADDCLQWGSGLPKVVSPHPVADWPLSPQALKSEPPTPTKPLFHTMVLGGEAVRLKLFDPEGKLAWSCSLASAAAKQCDPAHGWLNATPLYLLKPYKLRVESGKATAVREFFADGTEARFKAWVLAGRAPAISLLRILRSSADVTLEQAWAPAEGASPLYRLHNRSPRTIYGTSTHGNFFGDIERWNVDHWEEVRKVSCGTVQPGGPLAPGESTAADLGCVIESTALTPGKYRFWLTYAHIAQIMEPWPQSLDEFEVDAEFTIVAQP